MDLLNKHILETWSNDGYVQKWLRFVNRKGKKYFFADTQADYRCKRNGEETYSFYKRTAKRYFVKKGNNFKLITFFFCRLDLQALFISNSNIFKTKKNPFTRKQMDFNQHNHSNQIKSNQR
jgi:hypothetical protein